MLTAGAVQWVDLVDAVDELSPAFAQSAPGSRLGRLTLGPGKRLVPSPVRGTNPVGIDAVDAELGVEVLGRCLEGMQKEALVRVGESPPWRMVSDEGPYLEGTDLAPFPLAFFTPGCSSRFSPSSRGFRAKKASHLTRRGLFRTTSIRWRACFSSSLPTAMNPRGILERLKPAEPARLPVAIEKVAAAAVVHGVEGGAGTSLSHEQKRTLYIHGEARLQEGLRAETTIQLFKPIGSTFRFHSDESEDGAPSSLAYLCAGVAFCYLTRIGGYARIVRRCSIRTPSVSARRSGASPRRRTIPWWAVRARSTRWYSSRAL